MFHKFYINQLIEDNVGRKDPGGTKLDLGPTHPINCSTKSDIYYPSESDPETKYLLSSSATNPPMADIIDATSEPSPARNPPPPRKPETWNSQTLLKPTAAALNPEIFQDHPTGPTFVSISTTDSENNADFGIESNEGDQLPLIRGQGHQGHFIHKLLRRLCFKSSLPLTLPLHQSDDEEDMEDDVKKLKNCGPCQSSKEDEGSQGSQRSNNLSLGILLASISCIFFATSSLIVKVSSLHPMELLCVRGLIQAILVIPIMLSSKSNFFGPSGFRGLLLARATLGSVSLIMAFNSIHLIPLADASTVIFTSPVFVSLFACFCLGELCTLFDVSMISLTVLGVILVSKPSFGLLEQTGQGQGQGLGQVNSWTNMVGTFCGICAAMLTALAFIVLRQLKPVHYSVTVFWFSSVLAIFGAVLTVALDGLSLPRDWIAIMECLGIGICGFLGQILLTKSLQLENAGPVAVARSLDIVLSFFYQITLLHDRPDMYSYIGSALVVACVILTGLRRWYTDTRAQRSAALCAGSTCRCRDGNIS